MNDFRPVRMGEEPKTSYLSTFLVIAVSVLAIVTISIIALYALAKDTNTINSTTQGTVIIGNVEIRNTTTQSGSLKLKGNVTAVGGTFDILTVITPNGFTYPSDKSLKKDIKTIPDEFFIDIIRKINPVSYRFRQSYAKPNGIPEDVAYNGYIANEMLKINKDFVVKKPLLVSKNGAIVLEEKLQINQLEMLNVALGATKALLVKIEILEKKYNEFSERMKSENLKSKG